VTTFEERSVRRLLAVTSMLLSYPEQTTLERLGAVQNAAASLPAGSAEGVMQVASWLRSTELVAAQAHYVEIFDRRRRACLYLTYFLNGDTRRRGMALVGFKESYQAAGFDIGNEELPDFLPVVLEFGAVGDIAVALELLAQHRSGIEVLSAALHRFSSPYAHAVDALLVVVPAAPEGPTAQELAAAGPPSEVVGLAPFVPVDSLKVGARA
jgi:nitrate reductase delta subunit